jgi:hypothetical protein
MTTRCRENDIMSCKRSHPLAAASAKPELARRSRPDCGLALSLRDNVSTHARFGAVRPARHCHPRLAVIIVRVPIHARPVGASILSIKEQDFPWRLWPDARASPLKARTSPPGRLTCDVCHGPIAASDFCVVDERSVACHLGCWRPARPGTTPPDFRTKGAYSRRASGKGLG